MVFDQTESVHAFFFSGHLLQLNAEIDSSMGTWHKGLDTSNSSGFTVGLMMITGKTQSLSVVAHHLVLDLAPWLIPWYGLEHVKRHNL